MPRPRPFVRMRLAWLLSGLMLAVVAGEWEAARLLALDVLDLLQGLVGDQGGGRGDGESPSPPRPST